MSEYQGKAMQCQSITGPGSVSASTQTRDEQRVANEMRELIRQNRELSIRLDETRSVLREVYDALSGNTNSSLEIKILTVKILDALCRGPL